MISLFVMDIGIFIYIICMVNGLTNLKKIQKVIFLEKQNQN